VFLSFVNKNLIVELLWRGRGTQRCMIGRREVTASITVRLSKEITKRFSILFENFRFSLVHVLFWR
jgi:hypothetical protein